MYLTLDQAQTNYDNETIDERNFCDVCEDEIDGNFEYISNKLCCECCSEKVEE